MTSADAFILAGVDGVTKEASNSLSPSLTSYETLTPSSADTGNTGSTGNTGNTGNTDCVSGINLSSEVKTPSLHPFIPPTFSERSAPGVGGGTTVLCSG